MSDDDTPHHVGHRVSQVRKLADLSQTKLAKRANVSVRLLRAVEQGERPASPAFTAAIARALAVSPAELLAQPAEVDNRADYRVHTIIAPLRRELATYRLTIDPDEPCADLDTLATHVNQLSQLRHAADLETLGDQLPGVLAQLRLTTQLVVGTARERAYGLLAEAYAAAGQVVYKLGYPDLSSLTTERVEWAAAQSGDELAVAAADFYRAGEIINAGDWATATAYLTAALARIEHRNTEGDQPGLSMHGQLHLKSGLAHARAGNRDQADAHLAEARNTARYVELDRDDYRLAFNETSVNIWGVGLAVEAMDGTEAVHRAESIPAPRTAPRERIGHHHIDTARGWLLHGNRAKTFDELMAARRVSPQQTRHHPQVHETLRVLAAQDRRRSDTLAGFAKWAGVTI